MDPSIHPLDHMVAAEPTLREWRERSRNYPIGVACDLLAAELVARSRNGIIPELLAIAPAIERLLKEPDDNDFIESLQLFAEDSGLSESSIRDALGPGARRVWVEVYERRHHA